MAEPMNPPVTGAREADVPDVQTVLARTVMARLHAYVTLSKPRITALVLASALAAAWVSTDGRVPAGVMELLALATVLASAGGAALNHYIDRDIDGLMKRTSNRPLPAGQVRATHVLLYGVACVALAVSVGSLINTFVALYLLAGAVVYVGVYSLWLKRRTAWNIVIGGVAGSFAALAGGAVLGQAVAPLALFIGLLIFAWTPVHFWGLSIANAEDYRRAGVPMLPVVVGKARAAQAVLWSTAALVVISLLPYLYNEAGTAYLAAALVGGSISLGVNLALARRVTRRLAMTSFKLSGVYLLMLLIGLAL